MGYGLIPFSALLDLMGARLEWRFDLGGAAPVRDAYCETTTQRVYAAGDGAGVSGARAAMLEGELAGLAAASALGHGKEALGAATRRLGPALARERRFQRTYAALFTPGPGIFELATGDTVVCRCEGVTLGDLRRASARGAATFAEAKSVTRCGMGECQGRMCGQQAAYVLAQTSGRPIAEVGLNHPRPPVFPLPLPALRSDPHQTA
jgi:bacterioferritin-associated ferredoxin